MLSDEHWRRLFAAVDARQTEEFLTFLTPEAFFRYGSNAPAVGRRAIASVVEELFASIRCSEHRLLQTWSGAGSAVCQGEVGYVRLDGRSIVLPFCNIFGLRDGRIHRYEIYIDPTPLMAP